MSTRANIIIQDESTKLFFYRHSDGYPECCGERLKEFVQGYNKHLRNNPGQSAGWLILQGHNEYKHYEYTWKVGAFEPTDRLHSDIEYLYVIDLDKRTLEFRETINGFWDNPSVDKTNVIETVNF